jgi:hypothetical protein
MKNLETHSGGEQISSKKSSPPVGREKAEKGSSYKTRLLKGPNAKNAKEGLVTGMPLQYQFFEDEKKEIESSGVMGILLQEANIPESEKENCSIILVLNGGQILESLPPQLKTVDITFKVLHGDKEKIIKIGEIDASTGNIDFKQTSLRLSHSQKTQISGFIDLFPIGM